MIKVCFLFTLITKQMSPISSHPSVDSGIRIPLPYGSASLNT